VKHPRQWCFSVTLIMGLLMIGCAGPAQRFDEAQWRERVAATRTEDLYAPHFQDGRYFNPWLPMEEKGFLTLLKWKLFDYDQLDDGGFLPAVLPDAAKRIRTMGDRDFILWIGHATFLMRLGGAYWLTDPMLSDRALLPKRKTPPALTVADLQALGIPQLNVILSHNHYDHLDKDTLAALPENTRYYVPLGLKPFLENLGKRDVVEMDWWQSADGHHGTKIVCLPMQHWSRRIGQDVNTTLWASFLIITPSVKVYFAGDSGYFIGYREIGKRYPGIDYVLMPTTAYRPRWFMHYAHMDIDEAINAFEDLKAYRFIPTQWGTFHLGDDPPGYAGLELRRRIVERNLDPSRFILMDIGQAVPVTPGGQ
jgi:N-acyl-phosphatidylethanolamine-hydrolysing phospholipase D